MTRTAPAAPPRSNDRYCGEIIAPFVRSVAAANDLPPVQVIGGNGSAALLHRDTIIDLDARTIEAPASCDLPRYRPDGSLRDMDALVLSSNSDEVERVRRVAEKMIGAELAISIFGLKRADELERQHRQPIRSTAWVFLGDRYVTSARDTEGNTVVGDGFKALYPFQAAITPDTLDSFQLSIGGREPLPTAHPGATILNYLTRSISGLRAKDVDKVTRISHGVLTTYPEINEWIHDGPGAETLDLARVLHTLREPRSRAMTLHLGERLQIEPYELAGLVDHPGFMGSHLRSGEQRALIEVAHLKAMLLGRFEAEPTIVTFWQKRIEQRLGRIVHNEA